LAHLVDETLLTFPEVVSVGRRTGRSELDEHSLGVEASEIEVSLKLGDRDKAEFLAALRRELSLIPGLTIIVGQPISHRIDHMLSGTRASIAAKIFGPDLHRLRQLGEEVRQAMSDDPGVVDLSTEPQVDVPTLRVQFDRTAMAPWGLQVSEVGEVLQAAVRGLTVGTILEGHNSRGARHPPGGPAAAGGGPLPVPWRTDTLGDLLIDTPREPKVPLRRWRG
jgi:Cu/Ag efflux pump CusA